MECLGASGNAGIADDLDAVPLDKLTCAYRKNEAALQAIFGNDMQYLNQAGRRLELFSNKSVQVALGRRRSGLKRLPIPTRT